MCVRIIPYTAYFLYPLAVAIIGAKCCRINICNLPLNTRVSRPNTTTQVETVRMQQLRAVSRVPVNTELQSGAGLLF
jgi:hypothetical protein